MGAGAMVERLAYRAPMARLGESLGRANERSHYHSRSTRRRASTPATRRR